MSRSVLAGIMLVIGLHAFDELVLVISLPAIAPLLDLESLYGITIASYILAAITGMSWSGKMIDSLGPRKVLSLGLTLFFLGLIVCSLAWNNYSFIFARIFQGFGGGICTTCAFALINLMNNDTQKGKAITAIDLAWVFPSLAAPAIGGLLVDYVHWRAIFIFQIPIIILVACLLVPKLKHLDRHEPLPDVAVLIDSLRIAIGTGLFLHTLGQPFGFIWLLLILALTVALPSFNRVMPTRWWCGGSALALPIFVGLMSFTAFYGMEAYQPLFLIHHAGLSTAQAGFIVTMASIAWLCGSHTSSRLYPKMSRVHLMLLGNSVLFIGVALLGYVSLSKQAIIFMYPVWALAGFGMGITFNATRSSAMENTPQNKEGFVATAITLAANMGIALSSGFGGAIKNQLTSQGADLRQVLLGVVILGLCVIILNLCLIYYRSMTSSISRPLHTN